MNKDGFTLIEVLVVIVLVGLLAVLTVPNFMSINNKEKVKANESLINAIESAAVIYGDRYSNTLKANYIVNNEVVSCSSQYIKDITNTSDTVGCICDNNDCHYLFRIMVKDLVDDGILDEQFGDNCLYKDVNGLCLDCYSILLSIDDNNSNSSALFEDKKLSC